MTPIDYIWSDYYMVVLERRLWVKVMEYQLAHGDGLVTYEQVNRSKLAVHQVDLPAIRLREQITKHDVKARLDEFCNLSGHQQIHLGMTSADVVENTYLIRQRESVFHLTSRRLGKRGAGLYGWMQEQQFRGIRGPIGSDVDQMDLFDQDETKVVGLSQYVAEAFGFHRVINAVGQCMPRSFDLHLAFLLMDAIVDPIDKAVANGVLTMLAGQEYWLEGDVATSCVRRYAWPLLFSVVEGSYRRQDA